MKRYLENAPVTSISIPADEMASCRVAILLCTYNGGQFLKEQLESIVNQTHSNWVIYASDDGSSDATLKILQSYQEKLGDGRLIIQQGPRQGFAKNFMSLVRSAEINADFYAFSDQDDLWFADKLRRGLTALLATPPATAALFCSRTRLIDVSGRVIGFSPLFTRTPDFKNALVQSLAGANTMLLNNAARGLLATTPHDAHIISHDWLTYLLVSGCGGSVIYDPEPTLDYRQHGSNLIGSNSSLSERLRRFRKMLGGTFREWNRHNLYALRNHHKQMTFENLKTLECFKKARESILLRRLYLLGRAGVYRQTLLDNIGLMVAASIGRV